MLLAISWLQDIRSGATVYVSRDLISPICNFNPHTSNLSFQVYPFIIHHPLGLALLFTVRNTHEGPSVSVCPSTLYFWSHTNPLGLALLFPHSRDCLRIDSKLRTSALRSTRTRDLGEHTQAPFPTDCLGGRSRHSHTSIARRALSSLQYRIATFALQRTFRFTPLGLAFCFFRFSKSECEISRVGRNT